jgi:hypothetical protein
MTFDSKFKDALSRLPSEEKDKLILRFLKKDLVLAKKLQFELVSEDSVEDRREQAKKKIEESINREIEYLKYGSPGLLFLTMRDTTGYINDHVKTTKDKYGEVYLQIFLLRGFMTVFDRFFKNYSLDQTYKLNIYCISKAFKIMVLLKKLPVDKQSDFTKDLAETGRLFGDYHDLAKTAIDNGLDINWLIRNEIPDDIAGIEKELRKSGYLK